jgi:hypothetical protein
VPIPSDFSLKVKNYKCFGEQEQGFDAILPINVIIGKNNTGKSTLLEVVKYAVQPSKDLVGLGHRGGEPKLLLSQLLQEEELRAVFPENASGGGINTSNHWEYGRKWIGQRITYSLNTNGEQEFVGLETAFDHVIHREGHETQLARRVQSPFKSKKFRFLRAERNVLPEGQGSPGLDENGGGATTTIEHLLYTQGAQQELVEVVLLNALNAIYSEESRLQRIEVKRVPSGHWEVFLNEETKGRIALSHTGSGFKTVLLVLLMLLVMPEIEKARPSEYVFAFEELENNLHPALLRRLLMFMRDYTVENDCTLFLATHSNVTIDLFSHDENAQIIHVTHDGTSARTLRATTYVENRGILDDLDVRASDLLQANCVVWVEGPSDRLYFNRWIELWSGGKLKEGVHYQCVFYGGRLLAHLTAGDPDCHSADAVAILRLNSNAILMMDSDRKTHKGRVGFTKKRLAQEIQGMGGLDWTTKGREVENYLPKRALNQLYDRSDLPALEPYQDIKEYLHRNISDSAAREFERAKVQFAAKICPLLTRGDIEGRLDLAERLDDVCARIADWNRLVSNPFQR